MAIKLGLTRAEHRELQQLLISNHAIYIRVQILNLEHEARGDISRRLLGGQVNIDADAEITRSLELDLIDPTYTLHLDSNSPDEGAMYLDRMIRITYVVMDPDRTVSFSIPIFTGPIVKLDRSGPLVSVECQGKERLSNSGLWKSKTYKKGLKKTWVINNIMRKLAGENRLNIIERKSRLPRNVSVTRSNTPWFIAKRIARGLNLQLFYDGRGVLRLRKFPSKTVYVFRQKGAVLTYPQAGYDTTNLANAVDVIGAKPKGSKRKVRYRIVANKSHPLSPWRLGRNGVPRYLVETIKDDSIRSMSEARAVAKKRLRRSLIESVEVAFDSLPIPFLEEMDRVRIHTEEFGSTFALRKMTIPLTAEGVSSVGYLKRVSPNKRQIRVRRR